MGEMLYQGKVKQVWSTDDPDILEFRFTNQISVFDQIIPSLIPRKGESLNRTTAHWFKLIEEEGICGTHLVEVNARQMFSEKSRGNQGARRNTQRYGVGLRTT